MFLRLISLNKLKNAYRAGITIAPRLLIAVIMLISTIGVFQTDSIQQAPEICAQETIVSDQYFYNTEYCRVSEPSFCPNGYAFDRGDSISFSNNLCVPNGSSFCEILTGSPDIYKDNGHWVCEDNLLPDAGTCGRISGIKQASSIQSTSSRVQRATNILGLFDTSVSILPGQVVSVVGAPTIDLNATQAYETIMCKDITREAINNEYKVVIPIVTTFGRRFTGDIVGGPNEQQRLIDNARQNDLIINLQDYEPSSIRNYFNKNLTSRFFPNAETNDELWGFCRDGEILIDDGNDSKCLSITQLQNGCYLSNISLTDINNYCIDLVANYRDINQDNYIRSFAGDLHTNITGTSEITSSGSLFGYSALYRCSYNVSDFLGQISQNSCRAHIEVNSVNSLVTTDNYEQCVRCVYPDTFEYKIPGENNFVYNSFGIEQNDLISTFGTAPIDDLINNPSLLPLAVPKPGATFTDAGCINTGNTSSVINNFIRLVLGVVGGIVIARIIQGSLVMQKRNPEAFQEGKEIVVSALIGLLVIILSAAILNFIGINILNLGGFNPFGN